MAEGFCPEHGPYDASLGACTYCGQPSQHPIPPTPLSDDDLPTDLGGGYGQETAPTIPPGGFDEGEVETEIPARRAKRGILDIEEEEETELGRVSREDVTELEVAIGGPLGMLWVKEGARRGRFYPIRHGTVIGRKEGDLILDDPKVSSSHAKFTMEGDQFIIWDFGSSNGTYVNGKKIREATLLEENDLIKIGETIFVVKFLESRLKRKAAPSAKKPARKPTKKAGGPKKKTKA